MTRHDEKREKTIKITEPVSLGIYLFFNFTTLFFNLTTYCKSFGEISWGFSLISQQFRDLPNQ